MRLNRTFLILLLAGWGMAAHVGAQKAYRPVRTALKEKKSDEALKLIAALVADSTHKSDPKLYAWGMDANVLANDAENEKIYLKQAYDTLKFFNSTLEIFRYALACDSAEQALHDRTQRNFKFRKEHARLLAGYYPNLNAACRYFYRKQKYAEACAFLQMSIDACGAPIWEGGKPLANDRRLQSNAYLHVKSSFLLKDYARVFRYKNVVRADTVLYGNALAYFSVSALALGDTAAHVAYLQEGLRYNPKNPYFFSCLEDYRMQRMEHEKALALADSMLAIDSTNLYYLEGRSLALMNLKRYRESIETCLKSLSINDSLPLPYFYIGASYCNQANDIALPNNVNSKAYKEAATRLKSLYTSARPYLEKYRLLAPDDKRRWAPLLYRVYLRLNMGKQFDEMDKILKEMQL